MTKEAVVASIREIGILPAIRVPTADDARFAAGQMLKWGIPIVELTMTVPGALDLISEFAQTMPTLTVGAGTVLNVEVARACIDAGAAFITSPGLDPEIAEFTARNNVCSIPGGLTPSEIMHARRAGADMIKVFPCAQVGGPDYIRALKSPFPDLLFIAAGGVDQQTAGAYIRKGAVAIGVREKLMPPDAVRNRDEHWIRELAARFLGFVERGRIEPALL
jgi:2-dehydro-3-deoxyphosphogluconate aldolase/(4S)-4-hydroxy-2-oxoglutarate aldolase